MPVARHAERPAPAVRNSGGLSLREEPAERDPQVFEDPLVAVVPRPDGTSPVVSSPATAEREPVVCSALAVDEQVPVVGERLAVFDADLGPGRLGKRLRCDHERVQRQHSAVCLPNARAVAFERHDHVSSRHGPPRGVHRARRPPRHLGLLDG